MEIDGEKLKEVREDRFIGVRELSRISGVAHTTIVRLESQDRIGVLPRTIRKLASALDVDPKTLRADR